MPPNQSELSLDLKLDPSWDWSRVDDTILENLISLFCTSSVLYVNYEKGLVLYCLFCLLCHVCVPREWVDLLEFLEMYGENELNFIIFSVLFDRIHCSFRGWSSISLSYSIEVDFYYLLIPIICWFLLSVDFFYLCLTR